MAVTPAELVRAIVPQRFGNASWAGSDLHRLELTKVIAQTDRFLAEKGGQGVLFLGDVPVAIGSAVVAIRIEDAEAIRRSAQEVRDFLAAIGT